VDPGEPRDDLIAPHPDWSDVALPRLRTTIPEVDPEIIEEWKYMGTPVWSRDGILCAGSIFKHKVKPGFLHGASLSDPAGRFNGGLAGAQRRALEHSEGDHRDDGALKTLVRAAVSHNQAGREK
jgi:hypothetical protein